MQSPHGFSCFRLPSTAGHSFTPRRHKPRIILGAGLRHSLGKSIDIRCHINDILVSFDRTAWDRDNWFAQRKTLFEFDWISSRDPAVLREWQETHIKTFGVVWYLLIGFFAQNIYILTR